MDGLSALLLIGAAVGLYVWNTQHAAGALLYRPGNVTNMAFTGINTVATMQLIVQNPSNVTFTINSVAANAFADNTLIGNVSSFTPTVIPGNSQQAVPLTIELFSIGIVDQIINSFQNGFQQKQIHLQGTVNANGYQQPLDLQYTVGL
jgi:LEA14-like dessication related protein